MLIGYARVSTSDQDLSLQRTALKNAGCRRFQAGHEALFRDLLAARLGFRPLAAVSFASIQGAGGHRTRLRGKMVGNLVRLFLQRKEILQVGFTETIKTVSPNLPYMLQLMRPHPKIFGIRAIAENDHMI